MRATGVTVLAVLLCLVLAPPAGAERRGPAGCAATLDCTAADIDLMTMPERLEFVRAMSAGPAAELLPGEAYRWRNIEGIIDFFRDHDMGTPGTWMSYVDAGILEGVERGIALASGRDGGTFGNPGAVLWADYLLGLRDGTLTGRSAHDRAWSLAEQASTEYGVRLAEDVHGIRPTAVEERFFAYSEFYRWTLRNRPALLDPVSPGPDERQVTFVDWFTDVTNAIPARRGAELALDMAEFDVSGGTLSMLALFRSYVFHLAPDYRADVPAPAQTG